MHLSQRMAVGLTTVLALLAALTSQVSAQDGPDEGLDVTEGLAPSELTDENGLAYPNLGSQLSGLAVKHAGEQYTAGYQAGSGQGDSAATPYDPGDTGNQTATMLALSITVEGDVDRVVRTIEDNGGSVRNVIDGYIEAYVPTTALAALAKAGGVTWAREQAQPMPLKGSVTSEGVAAHLAAAWHDAGIKGQGVKVGVIDLPTTNTAKDGFTGLRRLMGSELPQQVIGRCYVDLGIATADLANCDTPLGNDHGTKVAETIIDVAPSAGLYISNPRSWGDLRRATEWMQAQGVGVIVYSVVWEYHGPADGTTPYRYGPLNTVKWAADNGIVWVNGAGNSHGETWFGPFTDADTDNLHEWNGTNEYQTLTMDQGESMSVFMRWDDTWGGASKDLALLFVSDPGTPSENVVNFSNDAQNGGTYDVPHETVLVTAPHAGTFAIMVKKMGGTTPSWIQLTTWGILPISTSGHSIMSPADSPHPGMLAVAAGYWNNTSTLLPSSSRGPTPDGRIKPDIAGAACASTSVSLQFCGTSASGPHVAGLAALVAQQNPDFTPAQITGYLEEHAARRGSPVPNNSWGHGFAQLPSHSCVDPLNGAGATSGSWTTSCTSTVNAFKSSRYYAITVPQQSTVTIDLSSAGVDAYLYLRQGYNAQAGAALHEDDDGGTGANSRISKTLAPGKYTIEATTTYTRQTGAFTLNVAGLSTVPRVSVTAGADVTEGTDATFTVTADPAPTSPLAVSVNVSQSGAFGVTASARTVTVPTGGSATLTIPTSGDSSAEPDGSVTAELSAGSAYTLSPTAWTATVAVSDDDRSTISVTADNDITEGDFAYFTLAGTRATAVSLIGVTISQTGDFLKTTQTNLSVALNYDGTGSFRLETVDDSTSEAHGTITVTLQSGPHYDVSPTENSATLTVSDNDGGNPCVTHVSANGRISGEWTIGCDSTDMNGRYAQFYTVTLGQQSTVTIDLKSSEDNYLFLRRGENVQTGRAVHKNDDRSLSGPDRWDALISESLDAGWYTIEATTYNRGRTGAFTLDISGLPAQAADPEVGITAGGDVTEGGDATFTVTASPAPTAALDVSVSVSQTGDFGVTTGSQTVTIPTTGSASLTVATTGDTTDEADGSVTATVDSGQGYTVSAAAGAATVAVADDDVPEVGITAGADVTEGGDATFTVTADPTPAAPLSVSVSVTQSGDFGATIGSRTVIIPPTGSAPVTVLTGGDDADEPDGSVTATVNSGQGYTISTTAGAATVTVSDDDDPPPACTLPSDAVTESEVTSWRDGHSGAAHVLRWNRVLAALGVNTGESPLTAAESRANEGQFMYSRWDRVTRTLEALEQCNNPPPPTPEVSITADSAGVTEGGNATFTVSANPAPSSDLTVHYTVAQSGDFGVTVSSGSVNISTGGNSSFIVGTVDDSADEPDGSVTVTLSTSGDYTISTTAGAATVTVRDDDDPPAATPVVSISGGGAVTEGGDATFTVTANPAPPAALTVSVAVTETGDFGVTAGSRTVTIPTSGSAPLTIATTGDSTDEPNGSVTATVESGQGYTVSATAGTATVTVSDDDDPPPACTPQLPSDAVTESEVTGWRDGHSGAAHVLRWNRVLAALGVNNGESPMTVAESRANEGQFMYSRWDRVTRTLEALEQCNNPPPPPPPTPVVSITADSASVTEGGGATFTVTANPAPSSTLTVSYTVAQTGDFGVTVSSGSVHISGGGSSSFIVGTGDDSTDEPDGSVTATLSASGDYTISTTAGAATVTVRDDDDPPPAAPVVSISADGDVTEGDDATFTVTANPAPTAALTVSVAVTETGDFGVTPGSRTVTIPTSGSAPLTVATTGDSTDEPNGSVTATITSGQGYTISTTAGTATVAVSDDDDPPPAKPEVSITAGNAVTEGDNATFAVTANPAPSSDLTVHYTVAQSGDFGVTVSSGSVNISTGGSASFIVGTSDDSTDETDGSVTVTLSASGDYTISPTAGAATVAVADDDPDSVRLPPSQVSFSVEDASATEGETLRFKVALSSAANARVRVWWTTRYGGGADRAFPNRDYRKTRGWLAFDPGEVEQWVEITLPDDSATEPSEVFQIFLGFTEGGATISDRDGIMTIIDND